jgi:N-acetylmuramoyl-L-alanine amidase
MRRFFLIGALLILAQTAIAVEIQSLRVWEGPEKTRTVLDISANADYRLFRLESPERVVIDIKNSTLKSNLALPELGDGLIGEIRSGRRNEQDLRIVIDLNQSARAKSFLLKPAEQYGHRLVIDLYPSDADSQHGQKRVARVIAKRDERVIVAIDAGHGGEDPGAIGATGSYEKDAVLAIAREIKKLIDAEPGMRGILIRDGDYYVPHKQRTKKARDERADLFISVHADAFRDPKVRGSGVFVLSSRRATSEASQWLADRENRADLVGGVKLDDKDDTLAAVLLDLSQSASMTASEGAAEEVLGALKKVSPVHKDHVESAPFVVLTSPDIPSMLVETAFISNPKEEKRLKSSKWRKKIAGAVVDGVRNYFYRSPPPGTWLADNRSAGEHIVSRGETLSGIASKHRVSLARLRAVNRIDGDLVRAGETLRIPAISP